MSDNSTIVIDVRGLLKRFGDVTAVAGVSFAIHKGEIFGFLGPNGAGKTTTVRVLTGVLEPTEGSATIKGHDIRKEPLLSRAHLAVVPEEANVYLDLTLWQNIMLMAQLHGIQRKERTIRAERLLDALGLAERKHQRARALSKGLRQRLMVASAMVTEPAVLFLDEPTSGLDVQSSRLIRGMIRELNQQGLTIFLTTHNMDEAEEMCSRVAIINKGKIAATDVPDRLRSAMQSSQYVEVSFSTAVSDTDDLKSLPGVSRASYHGSLVKLYTERPGRVAVEVVRFAEKRSLEITHLCTGKPSLEDTFLHFTSKAEKGAGK